MKLRQFVFLAGFFMIGSAHAQNTCEANCDQLYRAPVNAWSYSRTACKIGCDLKASGGSRRTHETLWSEEDIQSCSQLPSLFGYEGTRGDYLIDRCLRAPIQHICLDRCQINYRPEVSAWSFSQTSCMIGCDLGTLGQTARTHGNRWQPELIRSCNALPGKFGYDSASGAYTVARCNEAQEEVREEVRNLRKPAVSNGGPVRLFAETYTVPVAAAISGTEARKDKVAELDRSLNQNLAQGRQELRSPNDCGFRDGPPCRIWERIPSCNGGLVEDFSKDQCVQLPQDNLLVRAQSFYEDSEELRKIVWGMIESIMENNKLKEFLLSARFMEAFVSKDTNAVMATLDQFTLQAQAEIAKTNLPIKAITVGVSTSGGVLVGGSWEFGIAIPLGTSDQPDFYQAYSIDMGLIQDGDVGITVGLETAPVPRLCGEGKGFSFSVDIPATPISGEVSVNFGSLAAAQIAPDFTNFQGIAATVSAGVQLSDLVSYGTAPSFGVHHSMMLTTLASPNNQCACGGRNQRPCHLVEQYPSCNQGLRENFLTHRCE